MASRPWACSTSTKRTSGLGTPFSDREEEGEPGRLKVIGVSVKEAVKIFRKAFYGEAF